MHGYFKKLPRVEWRERHKLLDFHWSDMVKNNNALKSVMFNRVSVIKSI